ncbi:nuclear transport factor 2 family protein [Nocardia transvalensis]|uniref:nuclear transport factor 2 family protein n=1 Tax=Nocardia transvalensis TaxID=37333 RepID=UPI001894ED99|nr:nuclear transport factor 2 family protein [Nocardia transvalensis]MBF6328257.1 nuclear transport factor 2 family protein [Nocardia transvalensis]
MTTNISLVSTELYSEVQQFYGRQVRLLDGRDFEGYAATFTVDGEFEHSPGRPPARTRAGITTELRDFHRKFDDDPVVRRHWFSMLTLDPAEDGTIEATFYALVVTTRATGKPDISPSCVVYDTLVRGETGELLLRSRRVVQDRELLG